MADEPDFSEFALLSSQIMELGLRLQGLKQEQTEIQEKISLANKELAPLLVQHAKMIATVAGVAAIASTQPALPTISETVEVIPTTAGTVVVQKGPVEVKKRILSFLREGAQAGMSPVDIADRLGVPAALVREVMRESMALTSS